jgi:hypothetical protein
MAGQLLGQPKRLACGEVAGGSGDRLDERGVAHGLK